MFPHVPKTPFFSLLAALAVVTSFSVAAMAEDAAPLADLSATTSTTVETGRVSTDLRQNATGSAVVRPAAPASAAHSHVTHHEEHSVGADSDMTVDDEE